MIDVHLTNMRRLSATMCVIGILLSAGSLAQQLVLVKKDKIKAHFEVGTDITYALRSERSMHSEAIRAITDTTFITTNDTVRLSDVSKVDVSSRYTFVRSLGTKLIVAGVLLQLGDLITVTVVQNNDYSFDRGVTFISTGMVAGGFLLRTLKKSYIKTGPLAALLSVATDSPFYRK